MGIILCVFIPDYEPLIVVVDTPPLRLNVYGEGVRRFHHLVSAPNERSNTERRISYAQNAGSLCYGLRDCWQCHRAHAHAHAHAWDHAATRCNTYDLAEKNLPFHSWLIVVLTTPAGARQKKCRGGNGALAWCPAKRKEERGVHFLAVVG